MSIFDFLRGNNENSDGKRAVGKIESQSVAEVGLIQQSKTEEQRSVTSISTSAQHIKQSQATVPQEAMSGVPKMTARANHSNRSKVRWPQYGEVPSAIFGNREIKVIVEADLMCTKGFLAFAQVWHTCNQASTTKRSVFVPDFEFSAVPLDMQMVIKGVLVDRELVNLHLGVKDYEGLFAQQSVQGSILFLAKTMDKAKKVKSFAINAHKELRFFTLDDEGKLSGFISAESLQRPAQSIVPIEEQFQVATTIKPYRMANYLIRRPISKGASVYDNQGNAVVLLQEFMSNATSITYRTDWPEMFAKIYVPNALKTTYFEDKIRLMLQKSIKRQDIGWPVSMLYDADGNFVGTLVPQAEGMPLMQSVLGEEQLKQHFPDWNKKDLCDLTINVLEHIIFLQDRHIFFGCINPQSILVKDKNHVYFVDMDCYQIEGYPCVSQNITFQPPELQMSGICQRLYTQQTENYEIAELVFMLLMPGKTPYAKEKNTDMAQSIANMKFPFSWNGQPGNKEVDRPSGRWRFVWSHLGTLKGDFYNTFMRDKAFNAPEKRKSARFWLHGVRILRKELEQPYDSESLELFPKTFKRDARTQFFKCQHCGVEYPKFYFYRRYFDTPYRICNSCLNTPSSKSFTCISSYHTAPDRKFIYSKKMAIFHQLAAEQNPDWHKQHYCSECKHIRAQVFRQLRCRNCGCTFDFTFGQKEDYDKRFGVDNWKLPNYCSNCQKQRKRY